MIFKYLRYILRHKYFVFREGRKLRVPLWQLIVHDFSKFRPDEFFPYAEYFYGEVCPDYAAALAKRECAFNVAWLKHIHRNPHHWQFWLLRNDDGTMDIMPMPDRFIREMIADWRGAGMAQGNYNTKKWYNENKDKMTLHPATRRRVEELLGVNK